MPKIVEAIAERGELTDLKLTPHVDLPLDTGRSRSAWSLRNRMTRRIFVEV